MQYHHKLAAGLIASLKQIFPICTWTWCSHAVRTVTLRQMTNTHIQLKWNTDDTARRNLSTPVATASRHAKLPTTSLHALSYLSFSISRGIPGTFWLCYVLHLRDPKVTRHSFLYILPLLFIYISQPPPTQVSTCFPVCCLFNLCSNSTQHGAKTWNSTINKVKVVTQHLTSQKIFDTGTLQSTYNLSVPHWDVHSGDSAWPEITTIAETANQELEPWLLM